MSQTYEKRWSDTHENIAQRMTLMQDTFMNVIFRDRKCVEAVLQDIFDDPTLEIVESFPQEKLVNLFGKETQMDLLAVDRKGPLYNLEPQNDLSLALPQRARYYGSIIDTKILESGMTYDSLPEVYVIFITDGDMFKKGRPVYVIPRIIVPNGSLFRDGSCIMYLNCRMQDLSTSRGRLMHDFKTADPEKILNPVLRDKIREVKTIGKDGKSPMCKEIDELVEKREKIVRKEEREFTQQTERKAFAKRLHADGIDDAHIAKYTETSIEQVKAWLR